MVKRDSLQYQSRFTPFMSHPSGCPLQACFLSVEHGFLLTLVCLDAFTQFRPWFPQHGQNCRRCLALEATPHEGLMPSRIPLLILEMRGEQLGIKLTSNINIGIYSTMIWEASLV